MDTIRLSLDGMTCASCVARAERVLKALPGVAGASVNLSTETAEVQFEAPASRDAMAQVLGRAGYPVRQSHITLSVEGMTCAACTGRVERVLKAQPGVADAVANLATRRAEITLWQPLDPAALAAVVKRAGYEAAPKNSSRAEQEKLYLIYIKAKGAWSQYCYPSSTRGPPCV
jgi:Cu+-exporting ATPase